MKKNIALLTGVFVLTVAVIMISCEEPWGWIDKGEREWLTKSGDSIVPPPPLPVLIMGVGGYVGPLTVNYEDPTGSSSIANRPCTMEADGTVVPDPALDPGTLIVSIELPGITDKYLIGRVNDSTMPIQLNLDNAGVLDFRSPDVDGNIPIGTYAEFQMINTEAGARSDHYKQEADLDLMGGPAGLLAGHVPNTDWTPIADDSSPFTGTFDGGDKQIKRLVITSGYYLGLFSRVGVGGTIKNVHIAAGSSITTDDHGGGIAGWNDGTITACSNVGSVIPAGGSTTRIGGIAGRNEGTITLCSNTGTLSGFEDIGGIAGENYNGTITACSNTGTVSGSRNIGGIAGNNWGSTISTITGSFNAGSVSGTYVDGYIGGIAGNNEDGAITACYTTTTSSVSGIGHNGGIVGHNISYAFTATTTACYTTGFVSGPNPGGAIAYKIMGGDYIEDCYWATGKGATVAIRDNDTALGGGSFTLPAVFTPIGLEWGTDTAYPGTSGHYWKDGTTNGSTLPKLWWEP